MIHASTYCQGCGAQLQPGATFCSGCGARVTQIPAVQPSQPQQPIPVQMQTVVQTPRRSARGLIFAALAFGIVLWAVGANAPGLLILLLPLVLIYRRGRQPVELATDTVLVKDYKTVVAFQEDARRLALSGWRVTAQNEHTQRTGCLRFVLIGWYALLFGPRPRVTVTYQRVLPDG